MQPYLGAGCSAAAETDGYGQIYTKTNADLGRPGRTSQTAFLLHIVAFVGSRGGSPAPGFQVSHLCDRRNCFNPDHLRDESPQLNNSRMNCVGPVFCPNHGHLLVDLCTHTPAPLVPQTPPTPARPRTTDAPMGQCCAGAWPIFESTPLITSFATKMAHFFGLLSVVFGAVLKFCQNYIRLHLTIFYESEKPNMVMTTRTLQARASSCGIVRQLHMISPNHLSHPITMTRMYSGFIKHERETLDVAHIMPGENVGVLFLSEQLNYEDSIIVSK